MKKLLLLLLCATTLTYAGTLTHRYSFEDDATDSIAFDQADGTLENGVTVEDDQAVFPGGTGSANENTPIVNFPGKVWRDMDEATLEMWVTPAAGNGAYTPIAYFKGGDGVAAAISAIQRQRLFYGGYVDIFPATVICDPNVETHFVVTMKDTAFKIYKNGTLFFEGVMNGPIIVPDADGQQCWLGKAQWDHEPAFVGTVNEFRIYNFAISSTTISNNFDDGPDGDPDVPPPPTTYYVSQTGSDSNDGKTPAAAFKTVKHAMDQVLSDDTVHVLAGHYTNEYSTGGTMNTNAVPAQRIYAGINDSGFLANFTLKGDGPDKTFFYNMLDTNNFSDTSPRAFYLSGTGVTLKDFTINVENYPDSGDYAAAFYGWSCTNCSVQNVAVKMTNSGNASGVMFLYGTYCYKNNIVNVLVDGGVCGVLDRFWDLGSGSMHTHDTLVQSCTFVNQTAATPANASQGYGVSVQSMSNTVVQNCIFQDVERGAVYKQTGPIGGSPSVNDITLNSIIYYNTPELIAIDNGTDCQTIVNTGSVFTVNPQLITYNDFPNSSKYYGTGGWKAAPFGTNAPLASMPWPLVGNGPQRKGSYYGGSPADVGTPVWTNTTIPAMWGGGVADDKYYYLGTNEDPGELFVLDLITGADVAKIDFDDWWDGTPAVSENVVFCADNASKVYAVEKETWMILWKTTIGGAGNSALLLADNKLYVEANAKGLYCLDATSGEELWLFEADINNWAGSGAALSPDGSQVYIRSRSGKVSAINTTDGSLVWSNQFDKSAQNPTGGGIVDDSGNFYVMADNGPNGANATNYLVSYTSTGTLRWDYNFGTRFFQDHGSYALNQDGSTIYCSGLNGFVAINTSDGSLKWENNVGTTKGGCVVANGDVVIGLFDTGEATTIAVADNGTTGTVVWTVPLGAEHDSHSFPSLLPNGDVLVAGQHGQVMRIDVIPEPGMFAILSLALLALIRRK